MKFFGTLLSAAVAFGARTPPAGMGTEDYYGLIRDGQDWTFIARYAPVVYLHSQEEFFPSSVDFQLDNTKPGGQFPNFWTHTQVPLSDPYEILPWFYGQDPRVTSVPSYAFVHSDVEANGQLTTRDEMASAFYTGNKVVVAYRWNFPYNDGKVILGMDSQKYGGHVGDWEGCYIWFDNTVPQKIMCNHHGDPLYRDWGASDLHMEGERPVVYCAKGSHAIYFSTGKQEYEGAAAALTGVYDETDAGVRWDTAVDTQLVFPWEYHALRYEGTNTEWNNVRWLLYIYRWGTYVMGRSFEDEFQLNAGPVGPLKEAYDDRNMDELYMRGMLLCQGDDTSLCDIPVGLYENWPCIRGYQANQKEVATSDLSCFWHPYGPGRDNCREMVDPPLSCTPKDGVCGQDYGSASSWSDATNDGNCILQSCEAICRGQWQDPTTQGVDVAEIPHFYQTKGGEWRTYTSEMGTTDDTSFVTGQSCREQDETSAEFLVNRDRFHNVPTGRCLAGFVYSGSEEACFIQGYTESHCVEDDGWFMEKKKERSLMMKADAEKMETLDEKTLKEDFFWSSSSDDDEDCIGSADTCGDGWRGYCQDDNCAASKCQPSMQREYATLMRTEHRLCDTGGSWRTFSEYQTGAAPPSIFVFDGTNTAAFTCVYPSDIGEGPLLEMEAEVEEEEEEEEVEEEVVEVEADVGQRMKKKQEEEEKAESQSVKKEHKNALLVFFVALLMTAAGVTAFITWWCKGPSVKEAHKDPVLGGQKTTEVAPLLRAEA